MEGREGEEIKVEKGGGKGGGRGGGGEEEEEKEEEGEGKKVVPFNILVLNVEL